MAECTGQNVAEISKKECIGNSLGKINTNFTNLDISVCETGNSLEDLENLATTTLADYQNTLQEIQSRIPPPQIRAFVSFNTNSSTANAIYLTPGTFTWTAPTGVTQLSARIVGGGGGGGGNVATPPGGRSGWEGSNLPGGGGGGGANLYIPNVPITPLVNYQVIVGSGGAGGAAVVGSASSPSGTAGTSSRFANNYIAGGGGGGGGGVAVGTLGTSLTIGPAPGGASGGPGATAGGSGGSAAGAGGSSFGAGGTPNALANSGGGGRGGYRPSGFSNGGNGGSGRVELTYVATQGLQLIETYKVNQVIRNSAGNYTIKFDPGTFPNTNYVMIATDTEIAQKSANELRIITKQNNVPTDLPNVSLICV